jgi:selenocysteine-specific elongation factor
MPGIDAERVRRGAVITHENTFEASTIFDAEVEWLDARLASRARQSLRFYAGCLEASVDVRLLHEVDSTSTFTRISSHASPLLLPGDRFVLRDSSTTVAGGRVLDPFPPVRLNRAKTCARLASLRDGDEAQRLRLLVAEGAQGRKLANLSKMTGWAAERVAQMATNDTGLALFSGEQRVVTTEWLRQKRQQILEWLSAFHAAHAEEAGAPVTQLRNALFAGVEATFATAVIRGIDEVKLASDLVSLASHVPSLPPQEQAVRDALEHAYRDAGLQPPSAAQAFAALSLDGAEGRRHLEALIKLKTLVRITPELIFHADTLNNLRRSLGSHKGRRFSVLEFKQWTSVSRKYAVPLLEFLDRERITSRQGDVRVIL